MWTITTENDRRARIFGILTLALAACVAGCAGEHAFPPTVPMQPRGSAWVDRPLEQTLSEGQSKISEVMAAFLSQQQTRACQPDASATSGRVLEQAKARVMHAHSRAELLGEQLAMGGQSLRKGIDLTPIVPFAAGDQSPHVEAGLLKWRCEQPVEDACMESIAQRSAQLLYLRYFKDPQVSRAATARVLPVLRRDLEWGLAQVSDHSGRQEASRTIKELCLEGESPLGNFLIEHAGADDDQLDALVRRLGGTRPCNGVSGIYDFLLKSFRAQLVAAAAKQVCSTGGVGRGITARLSARSSRPSLTEMEPRRYSRAKAITDSKS